MNLILAKCSKNGSRFATQAPFDRMVEEVLGIKGDDLAGASNVLGKVGPIPVPHFSNEILPQRGDSFFGNQHFQMMCYFWAGVIICQMMPLSYGRLKNIQMIENKLDQLPIETVASNDWQLRFLCLLWPF